MTTLVEQARSYLESGGFRTRRAEPGFLYLERSSGGGKTERQFVWCDDDIAIPSSNLARAQRVARDERESALLRSFEREMRAAPDATGYYLVGRKLGLSQHFVSEATRVLGDRGGIRVPIEFFDTSYKIDRPEARRARSALGDVIARAEKAPRIAQSFSVRERLTPGASVPCRSDLVDHLRSALADPSPKPKLLIIDGPAGSGKSVAFNALVAALHSDFMAAKNTRQSGARPIVFLPGHLRSQRVGYVDDILAAVAETEVADLTSPEQFKWLLKTGRSIWMFDGLDEFYGGSGDFLSFVEDALTSPGSMAQFVICTRDSLLSTSPAVQELIERRLAAGNDVEIYDLSPWTAEACEELAWLELEHEPNRGKRSARVDQFLALLKNSHEIAALAQLPFYCRALLALFKLDNTLPQDDLVVLETLVECMIDREHGKDIFRWQDFVDFQALRSVVEEEAAKSKVDAPDGADLDALIKRMLDEEGRGLLFNLIAGFAHRLQRTTVTDLSVESVAAELVGLSSGTDAERQRRLRVAIVRFAFFGAGRKPGSLDFTHQILAEYLAARYARAMLGDLSDLEAALLNAVGSATVTPGSVFHRYFARELENDPNLERHLELLLKQNKIERENARSFVQLLLNGSTQPEPLQSPPVAKRRFGLSALFGSARA